MSPGEATQLKMVSKMTPKELKDAGNRTSECTAQLKRINQNIDAGKGAPLAKHPSEGDVQYDAKAGVIVANDSSEAQHLQQLRAQDATHTELASTFVDILLNEQGGVVNLGDPTFTPDHMFSNTFREDQMPRYAQEMRRAARRPRSTRLSVGPYFRSQFNQATK